MDYIRSKSEINSIYISENVFIKKISTNLNNQDASIKLNILGKLKNLSIYELTRQLYIYIKIVMYDMNQFCLYVYPVYR